MIYFTKQSLAIYIQGPTNVIRYLNRNPPQNNTAHLKTTQQDSSSRQLSIILNLRKYKSYLHNLIIQLMQQFFKTQSLTIYTVF